MIKDFFVKNKTKIIETIVAIVILICISVVSMLILRAFGIIYYDDGMKINGELFLKFRDSWYGYLLIILFQMITTLFLSFIPGFSMAFILLLQTIYVKPWLSFFIAFAGVLLTSLLMYIVGRFGGKTICKKILGEKDYQKAIELLNNKGVIYFPIMMLFPIFPDDALVMIAGSLKMSLKWFIPSIVIGRGIGVATIIFGFSVIPFDKFTSIFHWIIFVALCALGIFFVFYMAHLFNKHLEKKHKNEAEM